MSRSELIKAFSKRLYNQKNVQKICEGDYMMVPVEMILEWLADMALILGKSVYDLAKKDDS